MLDLRQCLVNGKSSALDIVKLKHQLTRSDIEKTEVPERKSE